MLNGALLAASLMGSAFFDGVALDPSARLVRVDPAAVLHEVLRRGRVQTTAQVEVLVAADGGVVGARSVPSSRYSIRWFYRTAPGLGFEPSTQPLRRVALDLRVEVAPPEQAEPSVVIDAERTVLIREPSGFRLVELAKAGTPIDLASTEGQELAEAALRDLIRWHGKPGPVFVSLGGKSPAKSFVARFRDSGCEVRPSSKFKPGTGVLLRIERLLRLSTGEVAAVGGYWVGPLGADEEFIGLRREGSIWVVTSAEGTWIS